MKSWRFIGFDDSFRGDECYLVGCITEGGSYVEGFIIERISVDGFDVTEKIVRSILKSKFREQIKCIFLGGITFGGFNIADVEEINKKTEKPVIVLTRKMPDFKSITNALKNVDDYDRRMEIMKKGGEFVKIEDSLYAQLRGCNITEATTYINAARVKGNFPEALRVAHLVASAIIHGESKGRV